MDWIKRLCMIVSQYVICLYYLIHFRFAAKYLITVKVFSMISMVAAGPDPLFQVKGNAYLEVVTGYFKI